jgi:hypothetical protein
MMNGTFRIEASDNGPPQAVIPNHYMWDFVEYVSFQRVHVIYTYCDEHFTVSFPSTDRQGVQRLLDEWAACAARSLSAAVSSK